jgi:hypothetical protein
MKRYLLFWIAINLMVFLGGCAAHYYRTDDASATVNFYLRDPDAKTVILYASSDGFKPRKAELLNGRWTNTLPIAQEFSYFYRVDGEIFVPGCRFREADDFGTENCIFLPFR